MEEPSPRSSRLALAGALLAAMVVGGGGFLLGRATSERVPPPPSPPLAVPASKPPPEPAAAGILGRAELIALAAAAADSAAGGAGAAVEVAAADGRRFEIRLPFGCGGPAGANSAASMRWHYDEEAGALRVRVEPVAWTAQEWWPEGDAGPVETVEGFWIERPWTSSEACPAAGDRPAAAGAEPVTLPGQSLAVGQVFKAGSGREGRRDGEPYQAVVRLPQSEIDPEQGLRLRLRGRIARAAGGGPIGCRQPAGPEQRPICLVSVELDEVAVENPASGARLATWGPGSGNPPGA